MTRYEIGGGQISQRRKDGDWINVDLVETADVTHDLNQTPWPIDDLSADEVYSSHCIEHVKNPDTFVQEIARICKVGALVEIRCPDAMAEMAMRAGHESTVSVLQIRHMTETFASTFWGKSGGLSHNRKLRTLSIEAAPDDFWFPKARASRELARWSDAAILDWIPRTCHERRFRFVVEECDL